MNFLEASSGPREEGDELEKGRAAGTTAGTAVDGRRGNVLSHDHDAHESAHEPGFRVQTPSHMHAPLRTRGAERRYAAGRSAAPRSRTPSLPHR